MPLIDNMLGNRGDADETFQKLEAMANGTYLDEIHAEERPVRSGDIAQGDLTHLFEPEEPLLPAGEPEIRLSEGEPGPVADAAVTDVFEDEAARRSIRQFAAPDIYDPEAYVRSHEPVAAASIHTEEVPSVEQVSPEMTRAERFAGLSQAALDAFAVHREAADSGEALAESPELRAFFTMLDTAADEGAVSANEREAMQDRLLRRIDTVYYEDAREAPVDEIAAQPEHEPVSETEIERLKRAWWDDGGRDALKRPFSFDLMAKKWNNALLEPYFAVKNTASAAVAPLISWHDARTEAKSASLTPEQRERQAVESLDRRRSLRRVAFIAGAVGYTMYRGVLAAKGLDTGHGMFDHVFQAGGSGAGAGHAAGFMQENTLPGDAAPRADGFNLAEHVTHQAEAPQVSAIKAGQGGEAWFRDNGLSDSDWVNHQEDMYRRFPQELYRKGNQVFLNHEGMPSKAFQEYVSHLKGQD